MNHARTLALIAPLAITAVIVIGSSAAQEMKPSGYAGSQACLGCHADKHTAWKTSRHAGKPPATSAGWKKECAVCHSTNVNAADFSYGEGGIGCEGCHGPGRAHAVQGDKNRIASGRGSDNCGRCHIAGGEEGVAELASTAAALASQNGPGMRLTDIPGLKLPSIDAKKLWPQPGEKHRRTYLMWAASRHAGSATPASCVSCHDPHNSSNPFQLTMDVEKLCESCHRQRAILQGKGAKGIEDTRSFHSGVNCASCHMSERNHLMRLIRPDDPDLAGVRIDTCTGCHQDNNRPARIKQLQEWQSLYGEEMTPLQADLNTITVALIEQPGRLDAGMKARLDGVKSNIALLVNDGSMGAHNLDFALEIMALARQDLKEIKAALK